MKRKFTIAALFLLTLPAFAQERQIQYNESVLPFAEWAAKFPREKAVMGLFKNYVEPTVTYLELGMKKTAKAPLIMYVTRIRATVNKPVGQINLPNLIKIESLQKLDPELKFYSLAPASIMPLVGGKGKTDNFQRCNSPSTYFTLSNYEEDLSYLNGDHPWCGDNRSTCVESCFVFTDKWYKAVYGINKLKTAAAFLSGRTVNPAELKDYGLAMQAEARYFTSEQEFGQSVKELTQINTPVQGIVELNIFYMNQVLQYGKILAVFQAHPSSPQATVVSTFTAIGIREKTWKKYGGRLETIMRGQASENTTTGITAGIPVFSQNIAKAMAAFLEQQ